MNLHFFTKRVSLPALIFLTTISLSAQTSTSPSGRETVTQSTIWFLINSNVKLSKRVSVYADVHVRYVDAFQPMQNQYRIAPEYIVSKKFSFSPLGFVYVRSFIYGKQPATYENNERRIYQQMIYKHTAGKFVFNHRARFEERFIQVHSKNSSDEIVDEGFINKQFRFRYRGMVTYPLNAPEIKTGTLFAVAYDEIFIRAENAYTHGNFDQNRFFAGLGYQFAKNFSMQTGFFHHTAVKFNNLQQEYNIGVLTQLTYNFDFSKNEN